MLEMECLTEDNVESTSESCSPSKSEFFCYPFQEKSESEDCSPSRLCYPVNGCDDACDPCDPNSIIYRSECLPSAVGYAYLEVKETKELVQDFGDLVKDIFE